MVLHRLLLLTVFASQAQVAQVYENKSPYTYGLPGPLLPDCWEVPSKYAKTTIPS